MELFNEGIFQFFLKCKEAQVKTDNFLPSSEISVANLCVLISVEEVRVLISFGSWGSLRGVLSNELRLGDSREHFVTSTNGELSYSARMGHRLRESSAFAPGKYRVARKLEVPSCIWIASRFCFFELF